MWQPRLEYVGHCNVRDAHDIKTALRLLCKLLSSGRCIQTTTLHSEHIGHVCRHMWAAGGCSNRTANVLLLELPMPEVGGVKTCQTTPGSAVAPVPLYCSPPSPCTACRLKWQNPVVELAVLHLLGICFCHGRELSGGRKHQHFFPLPL